MIASHYGAPKAFEVILLYWIVRSFVEYQINYFRYLFISVLLYRGGGGNNNIIIITTNTAVLFLIKILPVIFLRNQVTTYYNNYRLLLYSVLIGI